MNAEVFIMACRPGSTAVIVATAPQRATQEQVLSALWRAAQRLAGTGRHRPAPASARGDRRRVAVMSFLHVRAKCRYTGVLARQKINLTAASQVPEKSRWFLEELPARDMENARARFGVSW
jgi:hypothetical protein